MDLATLIGFFGGLAMMAVGVFTSGGSIMGIIDIPSIFVTIGGSYFSLWICAPMNQIIGLFLLLLLLVFCCFLLLDSDESIFNSIPLILISPLYVLYNPAKSLIIVVLPEPFSPIIAIGFEQSIFNDIFLSISLSVSL